jgi:hypothetical protein
MLMRRGDGTGSSVVGRGRVLVATRGLGDAARAVPISGGCRCSTSARTRDRVGLALIGVPNALLWGLLGAMLRFVPYIGPWITATFAVLTALAVSPGWSQPLLAFALFVVLEIVSNNLLEPWLFGSGTGLSPLATVASALFWTWLWGPVGLMLSIPLTICPW